jgi:hypothetical protein
MLFREIIAVYCENHMEHIRTVWSALLNGYICLALYFRMIKHGRAYSFMWLPQTGIVTVYCDSPEVGGGVFVRNIGELVPNCTVSHHRGRWWNLFILTISLAKVRLLMKVNDASLLQGVNLVRNFPDVEFTFNLSVLGVWNLYYLVYVYRSHRCVFARHIHDIQRAHAAGWDVHPVDWIYPAPLLVFLVWKPNAIPHISDTFIKEQESKYLQGTN